MQKKNVKKNGVRLIVFAVLLCLLMGTGVQAGWKNTKQGKKYLISKEAGYAYGWRRINKKWYYFNSQGYMQKGWLNIGNSRYYLNKSTGVRTENKWFKVGNAWYYAGKNGVLQKEKWIGSCYVLGNYKRASGWLNLGGSRYYLNKSNGKKTVGWKSIGGKYYYFNAKGCMQKSKWQKKNGKYCYLQADGTMAVNTWVGKYKVGKNGARTGETRSTGLVKKDGKYYYFDSNYKKVTGWVTVGKKKYYFNAKGVAVTGLQTIGGKKYYFDKSAVMQTGLKTVSGVTYYFGADGAMVKNQTVTVGKVTYAIDANGRCVNDAKGEQIAAYAKKFLGKPYVYGGNNLNTGVDCSGFTQQVMLHFKITIPRTADEQLKAKSSWGGKVSPSVKVTASKAKLKPGDLVFYGNPAYHVAIYIGNGKVIHASTAETGIIISNFNHVKPSGARRYW
ncbi:MAG: NlpC/P60 family protein [Eubacteriales bacterium]|nr:NlpC/P60 family protein [Eubacteriales bacterium]